MHLLTQYSLLDRNLHYLQILLNLRILKILKILLNLEIQKNLGNQLILGNLCHLMTLEIQY